MDKLEPILKNRFWILLVPLLSMNLWGYFSANGAMKAATKAREDALDSVKSGVPDGSTIPNEVYTTELKKKNELLDKYVNEELLDLWKRQQARMVWPPRVAPDIPKLYQAEIKDNKVRFTYQTDYPDVVRQLHESVEPFVLNRRGITWTPKVDFPIQLIPRMKIGSLTINSKQMWEAQEDIWVTQFILDAIRQMNKDADSETSAVVRRVLAFRLLGGDGEAAGAGGAAAANAGGMESSMMTAPYQGGNEMGAGGAAGRIASAVRFDPAEEFGAGGEPVAGGAANMMMMSSATPAGEGTGAGAAEAAGPLRYVKETPEAPYVERGFYLSVIINQNKLVDFLVALSNSEWPVRVVRFHFGKNPYAPDPFTAARGGNLASQGMGGRGTAANLFGANPAGANSEAYQYQTTESESGFGGPMGEGGMSGMGPGANTGYPVDALQHPDLVQLDLAGLITMYRQPPEEKAALEAAAAGTTTTPDATSAETPADPAAAAPTEPAAPAAGTPPVEAPAAESGTPDATPAAPAPEGATPTPTPPPAEATPTEGAPAAPPAAGTEPAPAVPAPIAESPAAAEAPPAETPVKP